VGVELAHHVGPVPFHGLHDKSLRQLRI
jgi:hypothetical protein